MEHWQIKFIYFLLRIFQDEKFEKRIEQRTVRKKG